MEVNREHDLHPDVQTRTNVNKGKAAAIETYVEVGVLTEQELKGLMVRVGGTNFDEGEKLKASGLEAVPLSDHLGKEDVQLFVISLRNLPCHEIASMRKMKVSFAQILSHEACLVEAARQLSDGQPAKVHAHVMISHHEKLPSGFKDTAGIKHLKIIDQLIGKVKEKKDERVAKVEAARRALDPHDEQSDYDEESSESGVEVREVKGGIKQESAAKPKATKGRKAAKSESAVGGMRRDSAEPVVGGAGDEGELSDELRRCAEKYGTTPACFYMLDPQAILNSKPRCGRSLDAVSRLVIKRMLSLECLFSM